jgi:hypothetical protein
VLYDVCLYSAGSADSQQKVRKLIDSLEVTQQHVVMLVEGRLEDFFKAVLGGLANKYLSALLPGLQVSIARPSNKFVFSAVVREEHATG